MRVVVIGSLPQSLLNFRGPLIRAMVAEGHEVHACAPNASAEIRASLACLGVRYHHVPIARAGIDPRADLGTLVALKKLFHEMRPDRVLAYTVKPVVYSCLAVRSIPETKAFAMIEGLGYAFGGTSWKQRMVGHVVRMLYRTALKSSAGVFFLNPDDRNLFLQLGFVREPSRTTLLNGIGVDLEWYRPCKLSDRPVFLLIARLLVDKGLREYYAAAKRIKATYPQVRFLLVGGLDENPMCIRPEELAEWQADGTIEYLGQLDDVRPALAAARVYVLPSYREGTPRTVLEAMAMGRPIITTDAPGCRETVIEGRNGFLVPVGNVDALAARMEQFILKPELAERMGQEGLEIASEKYDVHKVNAVIMAAMRV